MNNEDRPGPFVYNVSVRFHEVDSAGIVFFARIFHYVHDAFEVWLREIGYPLDPVPAARGYGLPLAHAEADFRSPIRLGEEVRVALAPVAVGNSSFTIESTLTLGDGTTAARVRTVHVCVEAGMGRSRALPEGLDRAIRAWLPA